MADIVCKVETEVEVDGRWIAEIVDVPGLMAYGAAENDCFRTKPCTRLYTPRRAGYNSCMSQKQLVAAIDRRFRSLSRRERITKIRELASTSPEDDRFIQKTFPELYREAFQINRRGAGVRSGAVRKRARAGARR